MRFLTTGSRLLVVAVAFALAAVAIPVGAHPTNEPDHGVDEETACTLWAADVDETNATAYNETVSDAMPELCALARVTDIPLDSPPAAVERWNDGDHANFPRTGPDQSTFPRHATLTDGRFVKDAYAQTFAVQPSTVAHLSPTSTPRYVAPRGTLFGTVDYRVDVPAGTDAANRRVNWWLTHHAINETRLLVDGHLEVNASGSQIPRFEYNLAGHRGQGHVLTLAATIDVELRQQIETCINKSVDGACLDWDVDLIHHDETVTVRDSLDVVEYDLFVGGYRAEYPNGDLGLVLYKSHPWLGHAVPNGTVRGVWRFYAARDPRWDDLVTATDGHSTVSHSPLHPLTVNAFPVETTSSVTPHPHVRLLDEFGIMIESPTLPANVDLDVTADRYVSSYGLATRTETPDHELSQLRAFGLVRGVSAGLDESAFTDIPIHRSNLTLTVLNTTDETVTVRVSLQNETGAPIETATRDGYVALGDRWLNTSASGTVEVTVPRGSGGLSARFVPGKWWHDTPSYVGNSTVVYAGGGGVALFAVLFEFAVPASLFLVVVFFVDRITGWRVWPPWRRL